MAPFIDVDVDDDDFCTVEGVGLMNAGTGDGKGSDIMLGDPSKASCEAVFSDSPERLLDRPSLSAETVLKLLLDSSSKRSNDDFLPILDGLLECVLMFILTQLEAVDSGRPFSSTDRSKLLFEVAYCFRLSKATILLGFLTKGGTATGENEPKLDSYFASLSIAADLLVALVRGIS